MALPVLLFLSILLATFVLVVAMTRPSPQEKTDRTSGWHRSAEQKNQGGATPESEQLFKATSTRQVWLAGRNPGTLTQFAQTLQMRILQAGSSTNVCVP